MSLAKAFVTATVVKAPEKRFTQNDMAITSFTVNLDKTTQTLIRVSAFGQLAETIASTIAVNDMVVIEGRLQINSYQTPSGKEKRVFEISANAVEKMSSNNEVSVQQASSPDSSIVSFEQGEVADDLIDEDEIPF